MRTVHGPHPRNPADRIKSVKMERDERGSVLGIAIGGSTSACLLSC